MATINMQDKFQRLNENCLINDYQGSVADYAIEASKEDPDFFRWLFEDPSLDDFENPDEMMFKKFVDFCK